MVDTPRTPFESTDADLVCAHGTAMDVHCCNCHSGFLFTPDACVCVWGGDDDGGDAMTEGFVNAA